MKLPTWERVIKHVILLVLPQLTHFGVRYDWELPPDFVVTEHAAQRLQIRSPIAPAKLKQVVAKAWDSKQGVEVIAKYRAYAKKRAESSDQYRVFQGLIFVFVCRYNKYLGYSQKTLVTVISPEEYAPKRKR